MERPPSHYAVLSVAAACVLLLGQVMFPVLHARHLASHAPELYAAIPSAEIHPDCPEHPGPDEHPSDDESCPVCASFIATRQALNTPGEPVATAPAADRWVPVCEPRARETSRPGLTATSPRGPPAA